MTKILHNLYNFHTKFYDDQSTRNLVVTVTSRQIDRWSAERLKLKYFALISQAFCDLSIVINS